ncbi:MAG TPA: acyl-CoA dehydratase activase [Candidatus Deferrimicrobium sp.]|nr:acyl-CoA dehydratase activase [Candidatus Deferrimicrobium sp.]
MGQCFLGIDLGSSYTKFAVIDNLNRIAHIAVIPTLSRRHEEFDNEMSMIRQRYSVTRTCATGYGRRSIDADLRNTELICAAAGVSLLHPVHKCILDIGGEDIKVIESDARGAVISFFMNNKCSAGTGTFITEIAERAELETGEMSELARKSASRSVMNSFCTVFAKSEILGWKFNGTPIEDVARGIYLSVVDRICKLPLKTNFPLFLCGGVIAYHPYLGELLAEAIGAEIQVVAQPQFAVAIGAAVLARGHSEGKIEGN